VNPDNAGSTTLVETEVNMSHGFFLELSCLFVFKTQTVNSTK
jgi:hypothetical protein